MGWFKEFVEDTIDYVEDFGKALEDNPVQAVIAGTVGFFTGGPAGAAIGVTSVGVSGVEMNKAMEEARAAAASFTQEAQGRDIMLRQPITNRRLIYGEARVSGPIVFMDLTEDNEFLHMIIALADHECEQVGEEGVLKKYMHLNDERIEFDRTILDANGIYSYVANATGRYYDTKDGLGSLVRAKFYDGTQTAADPDLVAESSKWTNDHVLYGTAYVYVRLRYNRDAFPTGIPNISLDVKGKKLYDPDGGTTAYSANPALAIRDFLTTEYGFDATADDLDDDSFETAKDICDETFLGANRYTINGTIDTGANKGQVLGEMLTCMAGNLIRTNGKWRIQAGKYTAPTVTLDEDDLRGAISVQTKTSRRDLFNTVRGTYLSEENNFELADYPEFTSSTFQTEDGEKIATQLDLPLTNTSKEAQRIAKIHLLGSRQQIVVNFPAKLTAFKLRAGDTVAIDNERFGWTGKVFRVAQWKPALDALADGGDTVGIDLVLREVASDQYDFTADEETAVDPAPNTNLPSPFVVGDVGLSVTDEIRIVNGAATTVLIATVDGGGPYAEQFEVQFKKSTESTYRSLGRSTSTVFEAVNVEDSVTYDVRAFAINALGVRSANFTTFSHQIVGKTAPPADVTGLRVNVVGTEAHLSWDAVADLDLSHYQVRHTSDLTSPSFQNAVTMIDKITATSATVAARTGTYFVRAVDTSGNASRNATSIGTDIQSIAGLNVVATSTQHPAFAGTLTDIVRDDSYDPPLLKLATTVLFDAKTGNFDDAEGLFDSASGSVDNEGEYEFDTYVDLGSKYTSRVTADMDIIRIDYVNLFDDAEGLFDNRQGLFDGDPDSYSDTNVDLFVATTDDDPASSPTWSAWKEFVVGDYAARALKFKAVLTSTDEQATPGVRELSVTVDMPDSLRADNDIASGTAAGGKVVTFSPAYKSLQGLAIVAENMATGDFYDIVSKDATGFTIRFKNSGGTVVDRTFDFVAKGYGELVS